MQTNRSQFSWALYDWANSAYATSVMAIFFPVFFKEYYSSGADASQSTLYLGLANSGASFILAFAAPFLGALADNRGSKKTFLGLFMGLGICACASLAAISQGQWHLAAITYAAGTLGFMGANIFYDSLIMDVSSQKDLNRVSTLGFSLGYLGGGLLAVVNAAMVIKPEIFGFANKAVAVKAAFVSVSLWWLLFALPLLLTVKEKSAKKESKSLSEVYKQVLQTLKKIKAQNHIWMFLIAYFFYIDGVNTIFKMAVDFGLSLGLESKDLIMAILMVQFIGFPAALFYHHLAKDGNIKKSLYIGLGVYVLATGFAPFITTSTEFFMMAGAIGLVQGGVQAMSRSYFAQIIPKESSSEYFGFYNLIGKFSTVLGPLLVGLTSWLTGSPRASILVVLILFAIGIWLLRLTPIKTPA